MAGCRIYRFSLIVLALWWGIAVVTMIFHLHRTSSINQTYRNDEIENAFINQDSEIGKKAFKYMHNMESHQNVVIYDKLPSISLANTSVVKASPKVNIFYIKMIKCASETLTVLLSRFAYWRELSVVLPPDNKLYLGWPYQFEAGYYFPLVDLQFNVLVDHTVYNSSIFDTLMPKDTIYITSIRYPLAQVRSMFNYYNLGKIVGIGENDEAVFKQYMRKLDYYEGIYKSSDVANKRFCIPDGFSMTRNLMSFNLGFPTGWGNTVDQSNNDTFVKHWIQNISNTFDLVMIVDYFQESIIMLKRLLNWSWKDILYYSQNVAGYNKTQEAYADQEVQDIYQQWSAVDFGLYEHFNRTFWLKVSKETNDLKGEVAAFQELLVPVRQFCDNFKNNPKEDSVFYVLASQWDSGFYLNRADCKMLSLNHWDVLQYLRVDYKTRAAQRGKSMQMPPAPKLVC